ncbi:MAG: DUF2971 domain-containing protein [Fibromonadales bacterium]|nr:DUF2971 domain-containing protein [Fibromonadales bacterium]
MGIFSVFDENDNFNEETLNFIRKWFIDRKKEGKIDSLLKLSNLINDYEEENVVWHYTKMETLEKIFPPKGDKDNGNIKLRFTNYRDLNDKSEALVLRKIIEMNKEKILKKYNLPESSFNRAIENSKEGLRNGYTFSTTHLKDSFAFWSKDYASEKGIAIGFNKKNIRDYFEANNGIFANVTYLDIFSEQAINVVFRDIYKNKINNYMSNADYIIDNLIYGFSGFYKLKSWECEEEARIVLIDFYNENVRLNNLNEVIENNKKFCYKTFNKNIISSIMLGPERNKKHKKEVEDYLVNNGYNSENEDYPNNIKVQRSHAFDLKDADFKRL